MFKPFNDFVTLLCCHLFPHALLLSYTSRIPHHDLLVLRGNFLYFSSVFLEHFQACIQSLSLQLFGTQ